jgi:decaprenyl-phosphate phosphoribosyltransferase
VDPTESRQDDRGTTEGCIAAEHDRPESGGWRSASPSFGVLRGSVTVHPPPGGTPTAASVRLFPDVRGPRPVQPAAEDRQAKDRPAPPPMSIGRGLVRQARPRQWIKNLLVFVAPGAGGVLLHWDVIWHAAAAFGIFCLAASGTYFLNDAIDVDADRLHPTKRFRPIAAGVIAVPLAIGIAAVLLTAAVGLAAALAGHDLAVVMALYAVVNVAYSIGLKNEAVLDLTVVSAGFVLRAIAGGVATGVVLSNWFIIVASFGSLLIVTGKRSGEKKLLAESKVDGGTVRQTLGLYSPEFLRAVRTLSAAVTVTAYCLWAFERASQAHAGHHPIWLQLSIVPFVVGLLHVVRLLDSGAGAAPEELAIHDHRIQIYGLCWLALFAIGIYA